MEKNASNGKGTNFYTPREVAARWRVTRSTVIRLFHEGKLPGAFSIGGRGTQILLVGMTTIFTIVGGLSNGNH
ncbi:MAG: helix-turn-helix domain-containing protein [bacterium]